MTISPDNPDDILAAMRQQLDSIEEETTDTLDYSQLSDPQLLQEKVRIETELRKMDELRHVKTQEGRDLHSQRNACLILMAKRGLR